MPATKGRQYELVLMLDPELPDERRDEIASNARQRIDSAGSLKHDESWGMRKLAYDIEQRTEADYRFYRFEGERPLLDDLDHNLKITDGVLRFRIFRVDPRSPLISPPDPSAVAARGRRDSRRGEEDERREEIDLPPEFRPESEAEPAAAPAADEPAPAPVEPAQTEPAAESELAEAEPAAAEPAE